MATLLAALDALDAGTERVIDIERVSPGDYWNRIMDAARGLDRSRGPWRLAVRVADSPGAANELPHLLAHLSVVGLDHDVTRDGSGAQTLIVTRRR